MVRARALNLLHINDTFAPGGTERFIVEQARWLASEGVDIKVTALSSPLSLLENISEFSWCSLGHSPRNATLACAAALRRLIRSSQPTVVHTHSFFGLLTQRIAFPWKRPYRLVTTLHNQGYLAWPARSVREKLRKRIHGWLLKDCDRITSVSEAVASHYQEQFALQEILVLPNPLPQDVNQNTVPKDLNKDDSWPPRRLVIPGRITKEKGHLLALTRLAELKLAGYPITVRILGDGPLREEVEQAIGQLGLSESVQILPNLSRVEFLQHFQSSDLCLIPSVQEGFGIVAIEAMALGVPVLANSTGGLLEVIKDNVSGWTISMGSPDSLVSWFRSQSREPVNHEKIVEQGFNRAKDFSIDGIGNRWLTLYSKLFVFDQN